MKREHRDSPMLNVKQKYFCSFRIKYFARKWYTNIDRSWLSFLDPTFTHIMVLSKKIPGSTSHWWSRKKGLPSNSPSMLMKLICLPNSYNLNMFMLQENTCHGADPVFPYQQSRKCYLCTFNLITKKGNERHTLLNTILQKLCPLSGFETFHFCRLKNQNPRQ